MGFLLIFDGTRAEFGMSHLEFGGLIAFVWQNRHLSEEELKTKISGKYGKLTPEQIQAIIMLVMTLLPLFFGG